MPGLPKIGAATLKKLEAFTTQNGLTISQALQTQECLHKLSNTAGKTLEVFMEHIQQWKQLLADTDLSEVLITINQKIPWADWQLDQDILRLLLSTAKSQTSLKDFIHRIALQDPNDPFQPQAEKITLMTLHASKGLEFPIVFITGCEEGLLPYHKPQTPDSPENEEEERRLFYVGLTRAQEILYLLRSKERSLYGRTQTTNPSPYWKEINTQLTRPLAAYQAGKHRKSQSRQMNFFDF